MARLAAVGLVGGTAAFGFATAAAAATTVTVTDGSGDHVGGSTVDQDTVLTISAAVPKGASYTISAAGPRSCEVASGTTRGSLTGGTTTVSGVFNTAAPPSGCRDQGVADDGAWTFTVNAAQRSSTSSGSQQVTLAIPPAQVQEVTAASTGQRSAAIRWRAVDTPQTAQYRVYDSGTEVAAGLSPASVCSGGTCGVDATNQSYDSHNYTVRAYRSCPGCGGAVAGPDSAPATVTFRPPAPGSGSPFDSGASQGPAVGAGAGATRAGQGGAPAVGRGGQAGKTSAAQRRLAAPTIGRFEPAPNILPPPDAPSTIVEQGPLGSYQPELPYANQRVGVPANKLLAAHHGAAGTELRQINPKVWQGLAAMLVLALIAGHVRSWLRRTTPRDL